MSYARLTLAKFKDAYPSFSDVTQSQYDIWVARAEQRIGERYGDYQQEATEYMTAHLLTLAGFGDAGSTVANSGATRFKSYNFEASISESVINKRLKGGLGSTIWGQMIIDINKRLFGTVRLVGFMGTPC